MKRLNMQEFDNGTIRLCVYPDESYEPPEGFETDYQGDAVGINAEYRCPCCGNWNFADSVWGFAGYRNVLDPEENCYITDLLCSAREQLSRNKSRMRPEVNHARQVPLVRQDGS